MGRGTARSLAHRRPVRGVVAVAFLVDRTEPNMLRRCHAAGGRDSVLLIDKHERQPVGATLNTTVGPPRTAYSDIHWSFYRPQRQTQRGGQEPDKKGDIVPTRTPSRAVIGSIDTRTGEDDDESGGSLRQQEGGAVACDWFSRDTEAAEITRHRGPAGGEAKTYHPPAGLKAGDRLELVFGYRSRVSWERAWPTDEDVDRLRSGPTHRARRYVLLSVWQKGANPVLHDFEREAGGEGPEGWWTGGRQRTCSVGSSAPPAGREVEEAGTGRCSCSPEWGSPCRIG